MLATATPPACYATVEAYFAVPSHHERGPFHVKVYVDGDYAGATWYGTNSGGQGVFARRSSRWCKLVNGGGAMIADDMVRAGVPRSTAVRLIAKMNQRG